MMDSIWEELKKTFVDDHRSMTRGYERLLALVKAGDFASACEIAAEIDKLAGPHIEFEESVLYPTVKSIRGEKYVSKLYDEHRDILRAIAEISSLPFDATPSREEILRWTDQLSRGLDHAASCGSLLSHLQVQTPDHQRENLKAIQRLKKQGARWTEFARKSLASK